MMVENRYRVTTTFVNQYNSLKIVTKKMLLEVGIVEDADFDFKVGEMAAEILADLYNQGFTDREVGNAITVLRAVSI